MTLPPGAYRVKASETVIHVRADGVVTASFETTQGDVVFAVLNVEVPPTPEEAELAQHITDARNRCVTTLITKYADQLDAVTDFINRSEEEDGEECWLDLFFEQRDTGMDTFMRHWLIDAFEDFCAGPTV